MNNLKELSAPNNINEIDVFDHKGYLRKVDDAGAQLGLDHIPT